jgi:CSLREA domain-containing protein
MVGRLVVLLVVGGVVALASTQPASGATFTVTSIADPGSGGCTVGECTLREAIDTANASAGKDTIGFAIAGSGPHAIAPLSDLPAIVEPVVIDGRTQNPSSPTPAIELRGDSIPIFFFEGHGLRLQAGDSVVRGLAIKRFFFAGITIEAPAGDGNQIVGNYIGTDVTGEAAAGNGVGVHVFAGSGHLIGGPTAEDRNVISGNGTNIFFDPGSRSTVRGNYIGTDDDGEIALGGSEAGIFIRSSGNVIGGLGPGDRNVISGNGANNILIDSSAAGDNTIQGNYVGTDADGETALGASGAGIYVYSSGNLIENNLVAGNSGVGIGVVGLAGPLNTKIVGNLIGTDKDGERALPNGGGISACGSDILIAGNVISGNRDVGLAATGCAFIENARWKVQGNFVGTDKDGRAPLGNGNWGMVVGGHDSLIGGTGPGERNIISNNSRGGVGNQDVGGIQLGGVRNRLKGNYIGTDITGEAAAGNGGHGVLVYGNENVIGGIEEAARNVIAYSGGNGVTVRGDGAVASMLRNSIHDNGGAGIYLDVGFGHRNLNDVGDTDTGPNDVQNFPVITDLRTSGGETQVDVELNSVPNTNFGLEFFHNDELDDAPGSGCDSYFLFPGGRFGEGKTWIGSHDVTTDTAGNWRGTVSLPVETGVKEVITATATRFVGDPADSEAGSTSDFSECRADVSITNTAAPDPVEGLGQLTHTIEVVNRGPAPTRNVNVADDLAGYFHPLFPITFHSSQGTCAISGLGGSLFLGCSLGPLARGATARITITGPAFGLCGTSVTNTATFQSSELNDPDEQNNQAQATTDIACEPPPPGQPGRIVVRKETQPDGSPESFVFTPNYGPVFSLRDGESSESKLAPGPGYSVGEAVPPGWDLSATCSDGSPITNIDLAPGETVICTFINSKRGTVIVDKVTEPAGETQPFGFSADFPDTNDDTFSLADETAPKAVGVPPGSYHVLEDADPSGFDLSAISCSDENDASGASTTSLAGRLATANVQPGETVTCTFTNNKLGAIVVEKQTIPDGAIGSFVFTGDAAGTASDNSRIVVPNLPPGRYTSTEAPVTGWGLSAISCSDANSSGELATRTATFQLDAGETVTCVFTNTAAPVFLVIDEDSIDNGRPPNFFSARAVNDQIAEIGLRAQLPAFSGPNVGRTITLYSGQVGDEGLFALKTIPPAWATAGPTADGLRNYLAAGPGLGSPNLQGDREALLDEIPDVTPLRATGLKLLLRRRICAVVYDGDISIDFGPLMGSLKGANLGRVALEVAGVTRFTGGSSGALPKLQIKILDADKVCAEPLLLLTEAPSPISSSQPRDVNP